MTAVDQKQVLWPDVTRFGARITVAFNPSIGSNFLKFTIENREVFEKTCGYSRGDIYEIMRNAGFYYAATEAKSRSNAAYDLALRAGASVEEADVAVTSALQNLHFYSPSIQIKKEWIRRVIPAIRDADFKQIPVPEIKLFDYAYLNADQLKLLLSQQQQFDGGEPGVFYTTPKDRELLNVAQSPEVTINALLSYRDLPPNHKDGTGDLTKEQAAVARFNSLPVIERLMLGQTLGLHGMPLKAPRLTATCIGYPLREDAVAANNGESGIERVELPFAMPVAFDFPAKRLLVIRDARYLEIPNHLKLPEADGNPQNAAGHWRTLEGAELLLTQYQEMLVDGLLNESAWSQPEIFAKVEQRFMAVSETMQKILHPYSSSNFIEHTDLIVRSGLKPNNFTDRYTPDFLNFLGQFKSHWYGRMSELRAERLTAQVVSSSTGNTGTKRAVALPNGRREDAGEKIGGARKDYAKSALSLDEINKLTLREMGEVVTKDNVWPPLDYRALREKGVSPAVAYIMREYRAALPVNPLRGGFKVRQSSLASRGAAELTEELCVNFITAVSLVRDALAEVKSDRDLLYAVKRIREEARLPFEVVSNGQRETRNGRTGLDLLRQPFVDGAGYKFVSRALPSLRVEDGVPTSYDMTRAVLAAQARTSLKWDWAIKEKVVTADDENETAKVKKVRPEPPVKHLEFVSRNGTDFRGGADVDEAMFLGTFSFRAIEYGRWLPQTERQLVLNHAYDSFMDLAKALGLPPKAMSLGGQLAIAFGARGNGGRGAPVAHYEFGRNVLNLTRMRGAGFLCHEFGHAFDAYLAKATGVSETSYATELKNVRVMPPLIAAVRQVTREARVRYLTKDEALKRHAMSTTSQENTISDHFAKSVRGWIRALDDFLPEDLRRGDFMDSAGRLFEERFELLPEFAELGLKTLVEPNKFAADIGAMLDKAGGEGWRRKASDLLAIPARTMTWYDSRLSVLRMVCDSYTPTAFTTESYYLQGAQYYDGHRSKQYWSTDVEMFARAFETWVQHRIENVAGEKSQYLVYGCTDEPGFEGHKIYPAGEEFERLDRRFVEIFERLRPDLLRHLESHDERTSVSEQSMTLGSP